MCCLRSMVSPKPSRANRSGSPPRNYPSKPASSPVTASVNSLTDPSVNPVALMKKSKRKEIQEKTLEELQADGRNLRQEFFQLRRRQASAHLRKSARFT